MTTIHLEAPPLRSIESSAPWLEQALKCFTLVDKHFSGIKSLKVMNMEGFFNGDMEFLIKLFPHHTTFTKHTHLFAKFEIHNDGYKRCL